MEKSMGLMEKDGIYIVAGVMVGGGKWYLRRFRCDITYWIKTWPDECGTMPPGAGPTELCPSPETLRDCAYVCASQQIASKYLWIFHH